MNNLKTKEIKYNADFKLNDTVQSVKEAWESIEVLAHNRVIDNGK